MSNIVTLSYNDFIGNTLKNYTGITLVFFKAKWCGHCQNMSPTYEKLSIILKDKGITCAEVDADDGADVINTINSFLFGFKVIGFPTIALYENGNYIKTYNGNRTVEDLINFTL
jgi:protein disulfide-isomerase A6